MPKLDFLKSANISATLHISLEANMESSDSTDSFSEWVHLHSENHPQHSFNVFPPTPHQGLQIPPPSPPSYSPTQPSSPLRIDSHDVDGFPSDSNPKEGNEIVRRLRLRLQSFRFGIVSIANRARGSGALWSFASVSLVLAAAVLLYSRLQRWRQRVREVSENRLILVIKEKDQKINQLFLHIAQMNEMLSARRRVPVVRVG